MGTPRLHVARAGRGPAGRSPHRHLLARHPPLRDGQRRAAVRGRVVGRAGVGDPARHAAAVSDVRGGRCRPTWRASIRRCLEKDRAAPHADRARRRQRAAATSRERRRRSPRPHTSSGQRLGRSARRTRASGSRCCRSSTRGSRRRARGAGGRAVRGDRHRAVALLVPPRHRAQLDVALLRHRRRRAGGRQGARRALRDGGQRPAGRLDSCASRCSSSTPTIRRPSVGGDLRPPVPAGRDLRAAGRSRPAHRLDGRRHARRAAAQHGRRASRP